MGLVTAHQIREAFKANECQNYIVYGPTGVGKTSYSLQNLMEIYQTKDPDILKKYVFFNPVEFLRGMKSFRGGARVPAVSWEDAGVWLYYLDFHDPIVKSISKMMQLIRTRVASVIFTTPSPTLILGKLRNFPQTTTIKIKKSWEQPRTLKDLRTATAYRSFMLPDLQKLRVKKMYEDEFGLYLPNDLYKWYVNEREDYVVQIEEEIEANMPDKILLREQRKSKARRIEPYVV